MNNGIRTSVLIAGLTALFGGVGYLIGGAGGMMIALVMAAGMNLFAYWNSDKMVLSMYGAQPVDARTAPDLYEMVRSLAARAEMPMPRVYIMQNDQPNAFATGRNPENAAVAVTTGILSALSREELVGVIAHELAHIKNRDTLTMTITATLAGAISMLANFAFFLSPSNGENWSPLGAIGGLLLMILAPLAAMLVQMAISRTREYEADRVGAAICGEPLWLASALGRIEQAAQSGRSVNWQAERNPATAHMFIINPLSGQGADNLFATHPSTGNRIQRLQSLAGTGGGPARSREMPGAASSAAGPKRRAAGGSVPSAGGTVSRNPWRR